MLESEHSGYLDYVGESMFGWSEEELKEFALKEINQLWWRWPIAQLLLREHH